MKIVIETIPNEDQRYPTVGDWYYDHNGTLHIKVSAMKDARHETLVAIHELIEVVLCKQAGISQETVDNFDMDYEKHRHPDDQSEAGDDSNAPYRKQHCIAT